MATFQDYLDLLQERPEKFGADDVAFEPKSDSVEERCSRCYHFYQNAVSPRKVCEIYRADEEEETDKGVPPGGVCKFFTHDGQNYPRLSDQDYEAGEDEEEEGERANQS